MFTINFQPFGVRRCGGCQLCCKLLPVRDLGKPGNARCEHQKSGHGCAIYRKRPFSCRMFSCLWLTDGRTIGLSRPDRAGYVLDPAPEFMEVTEKGGAQHRIPVIQVWCKSRRAEVHKDAKLRAYLEMRASQDRLAALIRFSSTEAFVLWAPPLTHDRQWHEQQGTSTIEHSARQILDFFSGG